MVPSDWKIRELQELATVERGRFSPRPRNDPQYYGGNMPFVQTGDITNAKTFLSEYKQTLNEKGVAVSKVFPANSILLTIAANIGDTAITTFDVACPDSLVGIKPNINKCDVFWLKMVLETKQQELDSKSTQNAQKNINLEILKPLLLLIPPLAEQKKIALILYTWDKAISTTEKILENSQKQKQALMQQLLTGKKRFSGFKGGWVTSKIQNLVTISKGEQLNRDGLIDSDIYPVINGGVSPSGYTDKPNTKANTITISEGGNSCGYVALQTSDFWCGGHCYALKTPKLPLIFLYQLLKFNEKKLMRLRVGSGLPNIQKKDLDALNLTYPDDSDEQMKIATVLSTADEKIKSLEGKLTFLKEEKKALMQQLLTGNRRVRV